MFINILFSKNVEWIILENNIIFKVAVIIIIVNIINEMNWIFCVKFIFYFFRDI